MSDIDQQTIMEIIYAVKAGKIQEQVISYQALIEKVAALGAEVFIAVCTEIPLLLKYITSPVPFYDPTLILAKEVVSFGDSDLSSKCN